MHFQFTSRVYGEMSWTFLYQSFSPVNFHHTHLVEEPFKCCIRVRGTYAQLKENCVIPYLSVSPITKELPKLPWVWYQKINWLREYIMMLILFHDIDTYIGTDLNPMSPLRKKCPNTELFLVRIFLYSDWIFSPNTGKYGPEITAYLDTIHAVHLDVLLKRYCIGFKKQRCTGSKVIQACFTVRVICAIFRSGLLENVQHF